MTKRMNHQKLLIILFAIVVLLLILSGCASQPTPNSYDPPGFFMGVFHGFTIVFSFLGSIFMDIRIYAFPNSGFMYDFGYMTGLFFWFIFILGAGAGA